MEIGLFTTDNVLLQTILFFITYSVVYSLVVMLYEDLIIRKQYISVGFFALALTFLVAPLIRIWNMVGLPYITTPSGYWIHDPEGTSNFRDNIEKLVVETLIAAAAVAVIPLAIFGSGFLLVDNGIGQYCKVWHIGTSTPQDAPASNITTAGEISVSTPTLSNTDRNISQSTPKPISKFTSNNLLGIEISLIEDDDIPKAIITKVQPNSIAMLYGIQEGDWLVVANGSDLIGRTESDYVDELPKIINTMENNVTENAIKRNGHITTVYLPYSIPSDYDPSSPVLPKNADTGMQLEKQIGATIRKQAGKTSVGDKDISGVLYKVTKITKGSPADKSGKIHIGDFVQEFINRQSETGGYLMDDWSAEFVEDNILRGPQDSWLTLGIIDKNSGAKKVVTMQRQSHAQAPIETRQPKEAPTKTLENKTQEQPNNQDSVESLDYSSQLLYDGATSCFHDKSYECTIRKVDLILEHYPDNPDVIDLKKQALLAIQSSNTQTSNPEAYQKSKKSEDKINHGNWNIR